MSAPNAAPRGPTTEPRITVVPRATEEEMRLRHVGGAKEYRKTATVHAVQMRVPFKVETLEGVMHGEAGDYLCEGPAGERWPVKRAIFEATYTEVERNG